MLAIEGGSVWECSLKFVVGIACGFSHVAEPGITVVGLLCAISVRLRTRFGLFQLGGRNRTVLALLKVGHLKGKPQSFFSPSSPSI